LLEGAICEGNVLAACLTTVIGMLFEHPSEFLDTMGFEDMA
jgi:hypothetical protein